jgi:biotin carboxylase
MKKNSISPQINSHSSFRNPQSAFGTPHSALRTPKRLLLLFTTTGYNAGDFVEAAKKLGVTVIPGTDRCHVLNDPWMDGAIPLRFGSPARSAKAVLQYAEKNPIDAIVAIGDKPTLTAALASKALKLPYNPPEAVEACRNKLKSRQLLRKVGLPVPNFYCYSTNEEPGPLAEITPFPCVLKPLSLSASQGVIRANHPEEFVKAFKRIAALLRTPAIQVSREDTNDRILVEDFVEGKEVALEGILKRGRLTVLALFDKPDPLDGPFFEETLYVTPSRLTSESQAQLAQTIALATRALGIVDGPIHAELRVNSRGFWILEVAARSIGGLCSRTLRFGTGISLEELVICHALGMQLPSTDLEGGAAGVMMIPISRSGYLHRVTGIEEALALGGIEQVTITAKSGQKLIPLPEGSSYLGFIFSRGTSPQGVEEALRAAHRKLRFEITPDLPVV